MEIVGIPSSEEKENLVSKVCEIYDKIGANVTENDIEACHRLRVHQTTVKWLKMQIVPKFIA